MRSSTIASEFLDLGHEVQYIGEIHQVDLIFERFQKMGISCFAGPTKDFQTDRLNDVLLIDSYTLDPADPFIAKEKWFKVVSISDSITPSYDVDLIIKPSLTPYARTDDGIRVLSGPNFTLLRNTITKNLPRPEDDLSPLQILIVGGGSDPSGFCQHITRELLTFSDMFSLHVFSNNVDLSLSQDSRVNIHEVSLHLDEVARYSDLALTLASSLSIELIARGMPVGLAVGFENQQMGFNEIISMGYAAPVGSRDISGSWKFDESIIKRLIRSDSYRNELRKKVNGLVDLGGARRIALEILSL
jgi:spore coat polysaccharide biosynthesis predicted glycosyltransferase SpsG